MTAMTSQSPRSIDRILSPEFVSDLDTVDTSVVRSRRDEAREEEAVLSYVRRLIHGKLDILRAELVRRTDDSSSTGELTERLTKILADRGSAARRGGRSSLPSERAQDAGRRTVEKLVAADHLARLPEMTVAEIDSLVTRLVDHEKDVSGSRRKVFEVLDTLDSDLVRRYRDGSASPGEVLGPRAGSGQ